jgi:hypothetical protein
MPTTHILVCIHGIIPDSDPCTHEQQYQQFWDALDHASPELKTRFDRRIGVEWGHQLHAEDLAPVREDRQLTYAQQTIYEHGAYARTATRPGPCNILRTGFQTDLGIPGLHQVIGNLREKIVIFGLSDVVYYCSADGECRVRQHVYGDVLEALDRYIDDPDVCLHIFAHSLGVTVAHDFLFGLFNRAPHYDPGFIKDRQGSQADQKRFATWRKKCADGQLTLGALLSAASQLPLLFQRSQKLVTLLYQARLDAAAGKTPRLIDSRDIGVTCTDGIQWKIFYDTDDLLAFPTREFYSLDDGRPNPAIMDYQVNSGYEPNSAHTGYWTDATVVHECAQTLADWTN